MRLDARPDRHLHRRAARHRHRPDVPALDVLRIRAVVERLPILRQRHRRLVLDESVGCREQHGLAAWRGEVQGMEPIPFIHGSGWSFRGSLASAAAPAAAKVDPEHQVIAREEHVGEGAKAPVARLVVPDLLRLAGGDVSLPDRVGVAPLECRAHQARDLHGGVGWRLRRLRSGAGARSPAPAGGGRLAALRAGVPRGLFCLDERIARPPHEDDAPAVGRPHRVRIEVDARRHVGQRPRGHVVNDDEAVVGAGADEGELPAVGRPRWRALDAPLRDEWLLTPVHLLRNPDLRHSRAMDLTVLHEEHRTAVRCQGVAASWQLAHAVDGAACRPRRPHGALWAVGVG